MSEPTPAQLPAAPSEPTVYRPVSGLAIAGLGLAGLFAACLVIACLIALWRDAPLLIPAGWFVVPVAAAILCGLGWAQVARSEGTRAGLTLAKCGLLVAIVPPLLYGSYRLVTELVLESQAQDFTDAWFDQLRRSDQSEVDAYAAFANIIEPVYRDQRFDLNKSDLRERLQQNPDEFKPVKESLRVRHFWGERGQKGQLPLFFEHELVQIVRQAGDQARIEPLGVRRLEYHGGSAPGYLVEQNYRITTPEGTFDVSVSARGLEAKGGGKRQWHVVMNETGIRDRTLTPRGQLIARLRMESRRFAADWARQLEQGKLGEAFLDTCEPARRAPLAREYHGRLLLYALVPADGTLGSALAACALEANPAQTCVSLPGYRAYAPDQLLKDVNLETAEQKQRAEVTLAAKQLFQPGTRTTRLGLQVADEMSAQASPWKLDDGLLQFWQPFELRIGSQFRCEGRIRVATRDPDILRAVNAGDASGLGAVRPNRRDGRWWIVDMSLEIAGAVARPGAE